MTSANRSIFIDPSYAIFYTDKLFDLTDSTLNRDGQLQPFSRLRDELNTRGDQVSTADYLFNNQRLHSQYNEYYSLGLLKYYKRLIGRKNVQLRCFLIMEPPAVAPHLYRSLPELTRHFERVYLHNIAGDGYSLQGVDQSKLNKLYWPQPYKDVLEPWWNNTERQRRIVVINGNHIPRSFQGQLYGKRIEAMVHLAKTGMVDLYGHGWNRWWSHRSMWPPYWRNYRTLMSIYKGPCASKYEVLSHYAFCLCFENMSMEGYLTEKIFDCLYAGTIPLYLGAKNIEKLIPEEAYIDCRKYSSWSELEEFVSSLTENDIAAFRQAGRAFFRSKGFDQYYNSLVDIFTF